MQRFLDDSDAVTSSTMLHARLLGDGTERLLFRVEGEREPYVDALRSFGVTVGGDGVFYAYVVQETRDADRAAVEAGYYAVPREASLADVAEAIG
jgi:hypothetical protein